MHPHFKSPETGRTLLELLLIMVVMALLTISAIMGFQTLSTKVATQSVSKTIERYVVERRHEAMTTIGHTPHEVLDIAGPHGVVFDISNDIENNLIVIKTKSHNKNLIRVLGGADILRADAYSIDPPVIADVESFVIMRFKQYPTGGLDVNSAITCAAGEVCDQCTDSTKPVWNGVKCVCDETSCDSGYCESSGECVPCRDVPNYLADGSESQSGTMCCPDGHSSAVDGVCCSNDAPYCKEVNYLQSPGKPYIDTGIKPTNNTYMKFKGTIGSKGYGKSIYVGVSRWSESPTYDTYGFFLGATEVISYYGRYSDGKIDRFTIDTSKPHRVEWILTPTNVKVTDLDTNTVLRDNQITMSSFSSPYTIWALGFNVKGRTAYGDWLQSDMEYLEIGINSTPLRKFIPVIDKNGKAGMYDKVESKVYYNKGTGKFSAG